MNNHTAMPTVTFGEGTDYGMLHDILSGWTHRIWLKGGVILVAEWIGSETIDGNIDGTALKVWNEKAARYLTPVTVPTDDIVKVEVM